MVRFTLYYVKRDEKSPFGIKERKFVEEVDVDCFTNSNGTLCARDSKVVARILKAVENDGKYELEVRGSDVKVMKLKKVV